MSNEDRQEKLDTIQDLLLDNMVRILEEDDPKKNVNAHDLSSMITFLKNNNKVEDKASAKGMHEVVKDVKK